jgi:hypothetical protein
MDKFSKTTIRTFHCMFNPIRCLILLQFLMNSRAASFIACLLDYLGFHPEARSFSIDNCMFFVFLFTHDHHQRRALPDEHHGTYDYQRRIGHIIHRLYQKFARKLRVHYSRDDDT